MESRVLKKIYCSNGDKHLGYIIEIDKHERTIKLREYKDLDIVWTIPVNDIVSVETM